MLYAIVSFDDTEETDIVPVNWIAGGAADCSGSRQSRESVLATLEKQHNYFKSQEAVQRC